MKSVRFALGLALMVAGPAWAQILGYEGGLSVASGRYIFTERTTGWSFSTGLALTAGPFTVRTAVPYLVQNTTLITGSGAGAMASGGSSSGMVADSGAARGRGFMGGRQSGLPVSSSAVTGYRGAMGDPLAFVSWQAVRAGGFSVTLGAGVKAPLTDTAHFGTGKWDAGASAGLAGTVGSRTLMSLDVSFWHLGDLPDLDFRDPVSGTASVSRLLDGWALTLSGSAATSALRGYDAPVSVGAGVFRLGDAALGGVTASVGLTETAPQVAIGVSWRVRIWPRAPQPLR